MWQNAAFWWFRAVASAQDIRSKVEFLREECSEKLWALWESLLSLDFICLNWSLHWDTAEQGASMVTLLLCLNHWALSLASFTRLDLIYLFWTCVERTMDESITVGRHLARKMFPQLLAAASDSLWWDDESIIKHSAQNMELNPQNNANIAYSIAIIAYWSEFFKS